GIAGKQFLELRIAGIRVAPHLHIAAGGKVVDVRPLSSEYNAHETKVGKVNVGGTHGRDDALDLEGLDVDSFEVEALVGGHDGDLEVVEVEVAGNLGAREARIVAEGGNKSKAADEVVICRPALQDRWVAADDLAGSVVCDGRDMAADPAVSLRVE